MAESNYCRSGHYPRRYCVRLFPTKDLETCLDLRPVFFAWYFISLTSHSFSIVFIAFPMSTVSTTQTTIERWGRRRTTKIESWFQASGVYIEIILPCTKLYTRSLYLGGVSAFYRRKLPWRYQRFFITVFRSHNSVAPREELRHNAQCPSFLIGRW